LQLFSTDFAVVAADFIVSSFVVFGTWK